MEPRANGTAQERTTISVQGAATVRHSPELATALITVEFDGPVRSEVLTRTTEVHTAVAATLGERAAPVAGVVRWSAPQLRAWEARPWNQQGEQLALVHHAAATLTAVFDDRERLSAWLSTIIETEGVTVQQLDWSLTEASRIAAETTALTDAVADARRRAETIGAALGFPSVHPVAISDPGLLPSGNAIPAMAADAAAPRLMKSASASTTGEGIVLEPSDLEIEVVVHARFAAE
ncbi:SIMPL domain-containing protein [Plantibacter flavus]|uniref:SIMPL domain-containing protein n=1 Tax=Plantibacter flavus TaxID=150123 RepID=UPI003F186E6F